MKTKKSLWIIIAALALCTNSVQAQGLGGILKKAKKILNSSNEPAKNETTQTKPAANNAAEEPIATGGTLINPLKGRNRQTLWGGCADANPKLSTNDT